MNNKANELDRSLELLHSFSNIHKKIMHCMQKTAINNNLSIPQYIILIKVAKDKEITQKKMREATYFPKSTLSQAINDLAELGLLSRQPVEGNRREMQLSISKKGSELIQTIYAQQNSIHQLFDQAAGSFTNNQFQDLLQTHKIITTYLEEQGSDFKC